MKHVLLSIFIVMSAQSIEEQNKIAIEKLIEEVQKEVNECDTKKHELSKIIHLLQNLLKE